MRGGEKGGGGEARGRKEMIWGHGKMKNWDKYVHPLGKNKQTNKQTKQRKQIQNFMNTSLFQALCYPSTGTLKFSTPGKLGGVRI